MELVKRSLPDGASTIDMYMEDSALFFLEVDTGSTAAAFTGGGDMEYYLSIRGEDRLIAMLTLLGQEVDQDLVVLLDEDGLGVLGSALISRFGDGLDLLSQYRNWMTEHQIAFREQVR